MRRWRRSWTRSWLTSRRWRRRRSRRRRIEERYGPFSADYFASDRSWRKKPFFAKFGVGESIGLDAFSVSWKYGTGYFHPPVGLIWREERGERRERERERERARDRQTDRQTES